MKNIFYTAIALITFLTACEKALIEPIKQVPIDSTVTTPTSKKVVYNIFKGQQFCDKNSYTSTNLTKLKFKVLFDNSAIYQTTNPTNQADINKLYGFSDNNVPHHEFSARFGWRWFNNQLEIFTYVYNNGTVSYKKVGNATIGKTELYTIEIVDGSYVFSFEDQVQTMYRASTTATAIGYKLYPYFGGDETAPHNIKIEIEEL